MTECTQCGFLAQWLLGRWTCNRELVGLTPAISPSHTQCLCHQIAWFCTGQMVMMLFSSEGNGTIPPDSWLRHLHADCQETRTTFVSHMAWKTCLALPWFFLISEDQRPVMTARRISKLFCLLPYWCTLQLVVQTSLSHHPSFQPASRSASIDDSRFSARTIWPKYFNLHCWISARKQRLGASSSRTDCFVLCSV